MVNGAAQVAHLEGLLKTLRNDIDGGIRNIRNAMAGHLLLLNIKEIQDHWLFMGHSTFTILGQDLAAIDDEFAQLDLSYRKSPVAPKFDPQLKGFWARPDRLGPPTAERIINMQVGL